MQELACERFTRVYGYSMLDYLARQNFYTYNTKLARMIGLGSAIFTAIILDYTYLNNQDEYVVLDRDTIYAISGIPQDNQENIENKLIDLNLLEIKNFKTNKLKHYYKLNIEFLEELLSKPMDDSIELLKKASETFAKTSKPRSTLTKQEAIKINLKKCITIDDVKSRSYLEDWVDTASEKYGSLSKLLIVEMCNALEQHSRGDLNILQELCKLAGMYGYKDAKWVIKKYDEKYSHTGLVLNNEKQEDVRDNLNELKNYKGEVF